MNLKGSLYILQIPLTTACKNTEKQLAFIAPSANDAHFPIISIFQPSKRIIHFTLLLNFSPTLLTE